MKTQGQKRVDFVRYCAKNPLELRQGNIIPLPDVKDIDNGMIIVAAATFAACVLGLIVAMAGRAMGWF